MRRKTQYAQVFDRWFSRKDPGRRSSEHGDTGRRRYQVEYGPLPGETRVRRESFAERGPAEARARQLNNEYDEVGRFVGPRGHLTFQEWTEIYYRERGHRPTTAKRVWSYRHNHLYPYIGRITLVELRAEHIREMRDGWGKDGYQPDGKPRRALAASTQDGLLRELRAILNQAVKERRITSNPATGVEVIVPFDDTPDEVLTAPEVRAIINAAEPRYRLLFELGAHTGLRLSELLGLTHDDIHCEDGTYYILCHRQLVNHPKPGQPLFTGLKASGRGRRSTPRPKLIVIPADLAEAITAYRDRWGTGPQELIFRGPRGAARPLRQDVANGVWRRASRKALGRETKQAWHTLRHFVASGLAESGRSAVAIAAQLGNTPAVAQKYYIHAVSGVETANATAIEALLNRPATPKLRIVREA